MEESNNRGDFLGNIFRQSSLRPSGSLKSTLSGRSTPRSSPSFRKVHSNRTPRREARSGGGQFQCIQGNRLVFWLLLITLWAYLGFYVQSRWAHGDNKEDLISYGNKASGNGIDHYQQPDVISNKNPLVVKNASSENQVGQGNKMLNLKNIDVALAKKSSKGSSRHSRSLKKKGKRSTVERSLRSKTRGNEKVVVEDRSSGFEEQEEEIPRRNTTYGLLVGPFALAEDRILEWNAEKRSGTCDRKGEFTRLVWSRKFVLIFHELSMTGAPLSMMELATELLSCGATVSAVVLSRKGGLMPELSRRKIKVLEDKAELSYKTAMKADLVIAGSAVCASWIEQYITRFTAGSGQIVWWIMENRREYFDRSKLMLNRVKMLLFLSESQSKQWLAWCEEEGIKLKSQPALIPLSVNDELAFVAGIPCSLNTPSFSPQKMQEKRLLLRAAVRKEMGLTDNDMLVMSLSSINPGKGQLLLLESAHLMVGHDLSLEDSRNKGSMEVRKLSGNTQEQTLKVLIGSVGSKSNKEQYVRGILKFLSQHSNLSKLVLWTPATTRVGSLYSAADAYIINSQGFGETFGRVTVEAMAFGLPVLGTDAGGTKEIVEHNVTGLLHPTGRPGNEVLSQNLQFLLKNPEVREKMGMTGRKKVEKMYLKRHMYKRFADILVKCMRIK